jgi:hypothetical protein
MYKYPDCLKEALQKEFPIQCSYHRYIIRDGQIIIRNDFLNRIETLNPTASQIFIMCNGLFSVIQILEYIADISEEKNQYISMTDTMKALRGMQRVGLIERKNNDSET